MWILSCLLCRFHGVTLKEVVEGEEGEEEEVRLECKVTKSPTWGMVGDGCADTPPHLEADDDDQKCDKVRDTCPDLRGKDPIFNIMNYMNDECMVGFTNDQAKLMRNAWDMIRAPGKYVSGLLFHVVLKCCAPALACVFSVQKADI